MLSIIWIFQNLLGHLLEKALANSLQKSLGDLDYELILQPGSCWNLLLLVGKALEEPFEKPGSHLREGLSSEEVAPLHLHLLHLPPYISVPGLHEGLWDAREEEEEEDEEEEAEPDGDEDPVVPLVFLRKPEYLVGYHPTFYDEDYDDYNDDDDEEDLTMTTSKTMMMIITNFLHPGILTPLSFMREHQTPLFPAPDN